MDSASPVRARPGAKDFFLYFATAVTLYISAGSLLRLLFGIINAAIPDPAIELMRAYARGQGLYDGSLRFAIASLLIVFPLYLFLSWRVRKDMVAEPAKHESAIRRVFIYFTLFLAGALAAGDLVALVTTFLGGELTGRFLLKILAVLAVAAAVFSYYLFDLRRAASGDRTLRPSFLWGAAGAVLLCIIGGFMVIGSPFAARLDRFDERKISELEMIQSRIINTWQRKGALPATLGDLNDPLSSFMVPADPQTGAPYEYRVLGEKEFELCAVFNTANSMDISPQEPQQVYVWTHSAGRQCFERPIDPLLYPVYPATPGAKPVPAF